jgi:hypothetical protein
MPFGHSLSQVTEVISRYLSDSPLRSGAEKRQLQSSP